MKGMKHDLAMCWKKRMWVLAWWEALWMNFEKKECEI